MFRRFVVSALLVSCLSAAAHADCDADVARFNAMVHEYNALLGHLDCHNPDMLQGHITLLDQLIPLQQSIEKRCPKVVVGWTSTDITQEISKVRRFAQECEAKLEKRREARNGSPIYDCSHQPVAAGPGWAAACLPWQSSHPNPPANTIAPQQLSQQAYAQCQSTITGLGDDSAPAQDCIQRAKVGILMNRVPAIARRCGYVGSAALAGCVDEAYRDQLRDNALRDMLAASIRAGSELLATPDDADQRRDDGAGQTPQAPPAAQPASDDSDDVYCLFVAHRIHEGDLAYSRDDQIPPECRTNTEVKAALAAAQAAHPAFPISGPSTDRAISCLTRKAVTRHYPKTKDGEITELPPC